MNWFLKNILYLIFLSLSCVIVKGQNYYILNTEMHMLQYLKPKDFKLNLMLPVGGRTGVQIGYSPFKHLGVSIAAQKQRGHTFPVNSLSNFVTSGHSYSGVVSAYLPINNFFTSDFGPFKNIDKILFQAHVGYNKTYLKNFRRNGIDEVYIEMDYQDWFYQFGVSVKYERFSIGYSAKKVKLDYLSATYTGDFSTFSPQILDRLFKFTDYDLQNLTISQFNIQYKFGFAEVYATQNSLLSDVLFSRRDYFLPVVYELGIVFDINKLIRKRNKE